MAAIRPILSNHFKPALLARMNIAPFYTLSPDIMKNIVSLKMDKLAARMAETHNIRLVTAPEVLDQIAARCTEVETGARNIDHIMNGTILPQMSREILARLSEEAMPSEAQLKMAEDGGFEITFE
jgi:type VI secretion system protein VasG